MRVRFIACRHGKYHKDVDKAEDAVLTGDGMERARTLGAEFAGRFPGLGDRLRVLSSSAVRTRQLRDAICQATGAEPELGDWLIYGPRSIEALIAACSGCEVLIACGHEFMLSKLLYLVLGQAGLDMKVGIDEVLEFTLDTEARTLTRETRAA